MKPKRGENKNFSPSSPPYWYFNPKEKPSREKRIKTKRRQHEQLKQYRTANVLLAKERDNNLCVRHYFLMNEEVKYQEVHHVYGHANSDLSNLWRESYESLICVCRPCHDEMKAIYFPGKSKNFGWVEELKDMANSNPINPDFIPVDVELPDGL